MSKDREKNKVSDNEKESVEEIKREDCSLIKEAEVRRRERERE